MISLTTLEVRRLATPEAPPIYLAPFGADEMAAVMPIDPTTAPYERETTITSLVRGDPADIAQRLAETPHTNTFGIYSGDVTPAAFNGIVELTQAPNGDAANGLPTYSKRVQALGVHIYAREQQGCGLGTAAVQAAMRYAIRIDQGGILFAQTADRNQPMRRVLEKLGFVHTKDGGNNITHYDKTTSVLQLWQVTTPEALTHSGIAGKLRQELIDGHKTFSQVAMQYSVTIC
ncbi:MAG TPA: GNAT family protein [Candidatus Saccharimonadales bacterium]|nr:GNAT family protein [Candidatus Saccharimonadales bacterium]